jgi:hypothetical protein
MTHAHKHVYPPALNPQAMHEERKRSLSNVDPQALNPKEICFQKLNLKFSSIMRVENFIEEQLRYLL